MGSDVTLSEELTDDEWLAEIETFGEAKGYFQPLGSAMRRSSPTIRSTRCSSISTRSPARGRRTRPACRCRWRSPRIARLVASVALRAQGDVVPRPPRLPLLRPAGGRGLPRGVRARRVLRRGLRRLCGRRLLGRRAGRHGDRRRAAGDARPRRRGMGRPLRRDAADVVHRPLRLRARHGRGGERVFVVYDPLVELDAMHAVLFRGENVERIRFRNAGPGTGREFMAMGALRPVLEAAGEGGSTRGRCSARCERGTTSSPTSGISSTGSMPRSGIS
jgi:hypothetical protein